MYTAALAPDPVKLNREKSPVNRSSPFFSVQSLFTWTRQPSTMRALTNGTYDSYIVFCVRAYNKWV